MAKSPVLCCGILHKKGGMGGGYRITRQGCKDNFLTLIGIQTKEEGNFSTVNCLYPQLEEAPATVRLRQPHTFLNIGKDKLPTLERYS